MRNKNAIRYGAMAIISLGLWSFGFSAAQSMLTVTNNQQASTGKIDRAKLAPTPQALMFVREQLERIRTEALISGITLSEVRQLADKIFADPPHNRSEVL